MHLAMDSCCMQGVLMVDSLTWGVLVPMLRSNPDPTKVAWAEKMFFNFYSYNTVSHQEASNSDFHSCCAAHECQDTLSAIKSYSPRID